jgi:hypothetical protein
MINVVSFVRLSGYHYRWNGARKYRKMAVSIDELRSIQMEFWHRWESIKANPLETNTITAYGCAVPGSPG